MSLKVNGRIWIDSDYGSILGSGKIELLEKIKIHGSIRQAAIEMKMSYRQAWQMVELMNKRCGKILILSQRGGKGGGKASLTESGEKVVELFHTIENNFQQFLLEQTKKFLI